MITIVRIVQISAAMPAQWDAWDAEGTMYYLRYECGHGTVWRLHEPGVYWPDRDLVDEFHKEDDDADRIDLEQFIQYSSIALDPTAAYTTFTQYFADKMKTIAREVYGED